MAGLIRESIASKYLEPGESLNEVLFGLIMTLTFTLSAGILVKEEGAAAARELLAATIGCNIAWGVIDGVLYLASQVFERSRLARLGATARAARQPEEAARIVADALKSWLEPVADVAGYDVFARNVADRLRATAPRPVRVTRADVYGGLASFWLVFLSSIPAAVPFVFIRDPWIALRVSNAVLIALLFVVGYRWARYTTLHPRRTGLALMLIGLALVEMAILLGG